MGSVRLEAGQWRLEMDLQGLGEPESASIARLAAMLDTDECLKAEASVAVSGWPERKASLQGGSPGKLAHEQR